MVANRICIIYIDTLIVEPYNLVLDESVYVKLKATNFYGDSDFSEPGNGATIQLIPDAPINLANDAAITNAYTIAFTWEEGPSDGSSPVLDYDVHYDQGTDNYVLLASPVT